MLLFIRADPPTSQDVSQEELKAELDHWGLIYNDKELLNWLKGGNRLETTVASTGLFLESLETITLEGHQLNLNPRQKEDKATECQVVHCDKATQSIAETCQHQKQVQTSPVLKSSHLIRRSGSIDGSVSTENRMALSNTGSKQQHKV